MKTITMLLLLAGPVSAYDLHEWGTFTTVAGSDGVLLEGLEREEAPLPYFTYSHFGLENGNLPRLNGMPMKGISRPVSAVTVKMETPVIYFHSDKALDVSVKVGFEGGTISQWYPDRTGGEVLPALTPDVFLKPLAAMDFSKGWHGSVEWKCRILSPEQSRDAILFKSGESLHWMRPRVPEANAVRTPKGETEGFLFYRGIGNFDPGLTTSVGTDDTLHLQNRTGGAIPFAFVFERNGVVTRWKPLKTGLDNGATVDIPRESLATDGPSAEEQAAGYLPDSFTGKVTEPVSREMIEGLLATGLLKSEATAMVETWWDSYFAKDGLRVFWVIPAEKTEAILPMEVTPAPEKKVRVIVGRSEVLRPSQERQMLANSRSTNDMEKATWESIRNSDRFGLAYQHRIEAMTRTAAVK